MFELVDQLVFTHLNSSQAVKLELFRSSGIF